MAKKKSTINGLSIKFKLMFLGIIPAAAIMLCTLFLAQNAIREGMEHEVLEGLEDMAGAVREGFELFSGDYILTGNGDLFKGETDFSAKFGEAIDEFSVNPDVKVTLGFGPTRKLTSLKDTTGARIVDTDISSEIWGKMQAGQTYTTPDAFINGQDYFAVYIPTYNENGSVAGFVFVGEPSEDVEKFISSEVTKVTLFGIVALIVVAIVAYLYANGIGACLVIIEKDLSELSKGNLNVTVSKTVTKRTDEIGAMGRACSTLIEKLRSIVEGLKHSSDSLLESGNNLDQVAGQSSVAADEISRAVEDISKGAISQAEEIENASQEISTMGEVIGSIVDNVKNLTNTSDSMQAAEVASSRTMQDLADSNDRTTAAIARIAEQIRLTNESVEKISSSAGLITNIAEQTNLLSLNASIEAARAGEAGKGFAVVAGEIQKLATQSDTTASEIQDIINMLTEEAEDTMKVMAEAEALIREQQEKLDDTKRKFKEVSNGIEVSRGGTNVIKGNADSCDSARNIVVDVISNLSAISEENAASAQETTASMQELNATINMLAEAAGKLKDLSTSLNEEMSFFQM